MSTTIVNGTTCSTDGLIPELKSTFIFRFDRDATTGFVTETWSFGENTACASCTTSSFNRMTKVSTAVGTFPFGAFPTSLDQAKTKDGSQVKHISEESKGDYISN